MRKKLDVGKKEERVVKRSLGVWDYVKAAESETPAEDGWLHRAGRSF